MGFLTLLRGIAPAAGLLILAIAAAGAGSPPLRPAWGSGDPLWHWPDLFTDRITMVGETEGGGNVLRRPSIWSGRVSTWHPFQIAGLSSTTFETGLSGGRWSGFFSGVFLSGEQYSETWIDFRFASLKPPAVWWIGCGAGGIQAAGKHEPSGWGGNTGVRYFHGIVEVSGGLSVDRMAWNLDGEGPWSWVWMAGGRLSAPASLQIDFQTRQASRNIGSVVVGIKYRPLPVDVTQWVELAMAYNLTLGTEIFHFTFRFPSIHTGFDLWTHGHPVLGWTPGISFLWGF